MNKIRCCCIKKKPGRKKKQKKEKKITPTKEILLQWLIYQKAKGTGPPVGKLENLSEVWRLLGVGKCGWQRV